MQNTNLYIKYAVATFILSFVLLATQAGAQQGLGPIILSNDLDRRIEQFRQEEGIVGLTVAIGRDDRLIYSKGFGLARRARDNNGVAVAMDRAHRSRIGSVSKAVISGPATYKALNAAGRNPRTQKLYGSGSLFGNRYSTYQRTSLDRFQPIIAMAIASDDRVYTWYSNGMVSVGTSSNLTAHIQLRHFEPAEGKSLKDIRAIAISPDDQVYAWYDDGSRSIGTSTDLDARQEIQLNDDGRPSRRVSFPVGRDGERKGMEDVVGIAIAKSNSRVYIWYDDGTVSSGTSYNFDRYFRNRAYSTPVVNGANLRFGLRGIGIAADDTVYAWASNGKAFAGHSGRLDAKRSPYQYQLPQFAQVRNIFKDITVQHLFDHTSGFTRSGDEAAAKDLFASLWAGADETGRYDLIHKHFLTTRKLKSKPGSRYSYSNHGMGLMTLIIPELTGLSYREYAINRYLRPIGLKSRVRAQKANPDVHDSYAFEKTGSSHNRLPFEASSTGLSAGGWTSSAQGLLAVTKELQSSCSYEEIDRMGFKKDGSSGKLYHNGSIGGGYAQLVLFPDDYVSASGENIAGYHIAVAINTSGLQKDIYSRVNQLINDLVLTTQRAGLRSYIDYWDDAWD